MIMKKPLTAMLDCNKSRIKQINNDIDLDGNLDEKKQKMELENKFCYELS